MANHPNAGKPKRSTYLCSDLCNNQRVSESSKIYSTTIIMIFTSVMWLSMTPYPNKTTSIQNKNKSSPYTFPIVTPCFTEIRAARHPFLLSSTSLTTPTPNSSSTMQTREVAYVWVIWLQISKLVNPNVPHRSYAVTPTTTDESRKFKNLFHPQS